MAVTSADIVNQAIQLIGGDQPLVTGVAPNFDDSPAGIAAANLYGACVATVGREHGWDFARNLVSLTLSGNPGNVIWPYEYLYPTNGVQVWQIVPQTIPDANNPLPTKWSVANTLVGGVQKKVIQTSVPNAQAVYNNNPSESTWDPGFREAVVRLLASELAMALMGRPDSAQAYLESGSQFGGVAAERVD